MNKTLVFIFEALKLPEHKQQYPWQRWTWWKQPPQVVDHFAFAASIVFAAKRLHPQIKNDELINQAAEILLRKQNIDGSWHCWADDKEPSINITAMVIHALTLTKPRGWELAVSSARDWLLSVQDTSGCWYDHGCPDSKYLTVLVLDALELSEGGSNVTFDIVSSTNNLEMDIIQLEIMRRLDEIQNDLGEKLDDLKRGQIIIYQQINSKYRNTLNSILKEIRQGRVEQGQLQSTIDSIRKVLKRIQDVGLPVDDEELKRSINDIYHAINSELNFRKKLELSIPIIPLLLEYKIELGAGVDLGAVWQELATLVREND